LSLAIGSRGFDFASVTEADMSDAFQDRENTFEKQFANDEAIRFRAVARRNKAVALWVADLKGLSAADAEKYADDFVGAQVGHSDDDVAAALKADLERGDVDLSDHRLRKKMDEEMAEALASVKGGK
jgi:hypothetical protein